MNDEDKVFRVSSQGLTEEELRDLFAGMQQKVMAMPTETVTCSTQANKEDNDKPQSQANKADEPRPTQADKADDGKLRLTLVPRKIIWGIAATREFGLIKYPKTGVNGWRHIGVERLRDAMMRHMMAYLDDPYGVAEDSGLPHIFHLAFNVAALCEIENHPIPIKELMAMWRKTYAVSDDDVA